MQRISSAVIKLDEQDEEEEEEEYEAGEENIDHEYSESDMDPHSDGIRAARGRRRARRTRCCERSY